MPCSDLSVSPHTSSAHCMALAFASMTPHNMLHNRLHQTSIRTHFWPCPGLCRHDTPAQHGSLHHTHHGSTSRTKNVSWGPTLCRRSSATSSSRASRQRRQVRPLRACWAATGSRACRASRGSLAARASKKVRGRWQRRCSKKLRASRRAAWRASSQMAGWSAAVQEELVGWCYTQTALQPCSASLRARART